MIALVFEAHFFNGMTCLNSFVPVPINSLFLMLTYQKEPHQICSLRLNPFQSKRAKMLANLGFHHQYSPKLPVCFFVSSVQLKAFYLTLTIQLEKDQIRLFRPEPHTAIPEKNSRNFDKSRYPRSYFAKRFSTFSSKEINQQLLPHW